MIYSLFHEWLDLFPRIFNKVKRLNSSDVSEHNKANLSDSQNTDYESALRLILSSEKKLSKFRKIFSYREILEHVDYRLGREYLAELSALDSSFLNNLDLFKRNDEFGSPRTYKYSGVGRISPTTLRYVYVAAELRKNFGNSNFGKVAEIGAGYGGQASILHKLEMFSSYSIFDLDTAKELISIYLEKQGVQNYDFPTLNGKDHSFDLVISNYAFSELPKDLQLAYLERVILKSSKGYMQMNSGKSNFTKRSHGKITIEELLQKIPNSRVLPEIPLSGPDNYLLIWD